MKVYLIGMPGCGKSTLGLEVAKSLQIPFIDLDQKIEAEAGKSISDIFNSEGEDYFRTLESSVLRSYIQGTFIMSTGGGAPCFHNSMKYMNDSGLTAYLKVSSEELSRRLEGAYESRPLLADTESLSSKIESLLAEREKFYNQAKLCLTSDNLSAAELRDSLLRN
jgi:shikimate kinase